MVPSQLLKFSGKFQLNFLNLTFNRVCPFIEISLEFLRHDFSIIFPLPQNSFKCSQALVDYFKLLHQVVVILTKRCLGHLLGESALYLRFLVSFVAGRAG